MNARLLHCSCLVLYPARDSLRGVGKWWEEHAGVGSTRTGTPRTGIKKTATDWPPCSDTPPGTRTPNLLIKSQLLYQLS